MTSIAALPAQVLSAFLYYCGFSRFTHGIYTPWYYAHQVARQPDDGSTVARIVPCMDITLATTLALGGKKSKRYVAVLTALIQGGAIVALGMEGRRDLAVDFAVFTLAVAAAALIWTELVACLLIVTLRTFVQYRASRRLFNNDYLIFIALGCHLAAVITCELAIPDMWTIEELKLLRATGATPSEEMLNGAESTYRARTFWWIMISITASTFVTTIFLQLFACGSPQNFLRLGGCAGSRHTYLSNLVFLFSAGTDIAGGILIVLIPFPLLWKLRTSERDRIVLIGIFLLPVAPIIFGVLRFVFCNPSRDSSSVDVIKFQLYSLLENTTAIITASIPSLRLFVTRSRNQSRVNDPTYYTAASAKRSTKSQHVVDTMPLESRVNVSSGEPFDGRMFSRIESEEEADIHVQGPLRGIVVHRSFQ
ncbi:uncharacterized protein AB675_4870 [Cyphellophora attinorum]|uniref:Rhodopsin domain-containing protein n=1 Tax=Cyphellophora attinorum TaxID=1664694 RepID=A0A0N0NHZ0_9EURO|nr:uncharacterized protein AB675_4870 [Phialophora attinorum]KPI34839.1 hypothetical protein AB675_4870 [Phialophora attinorum]